MGTTAILDLSVLLADETVKRVLRDVYRGVNLAENTYQSQTITLANTTPYVYMSLGDAVLTVAIPDNPVNVQITSGASSLTFSNAVMPLILPGDITSLQFTNPNGATTPVKLYIFQAA